MAIKLFDLYRSGYARGNDDGRNGHRRRAEWELRLLTPSTWLPGTDPDSYVTGYREGFAAGNGLRLALQQIGFQRP